MEEPGKFIVLEGLDGAGTTSMATEIVDYFKDQGLPILGTCEPYSEEFGPLLRKFISGEYFDPGWRPMAMLFAADRLLHCSDLSDVLAGGMNVVCDRYVGSTIAYQSALAHTDNRYDARAYIRGPLSEGILEPDLTIYLQAEVATCLKRRENRGVEDYYERLVMQYHVEEAYEVWMKEANASSRGTYLAIDANRNYWSVRNDCFNAVEALIQPLKTEEVKTDGHE